LVDVFISYPRAERARAEPIKARLEALGLEVFFDIDGVDGGAKFPAAITRALDASKAVLACCSPLYFTRPWCLDEAHEGVTRDILVPVVTERFARTAPPVNMRSLNFLNLVGWVGDDAHEEWRRTLAALSKLVGRGLTRAHGRTQDAVPPTIMPQTPSPPTTSSALWRDAIPGPPANAWPEMVTIPPGRFVMGSPRNEEGHQRREGPQREVNVSHAFALGKYPVTFAEWDAAIAAGAKLPRPGDQGWGRDRRPVINVSWEDAQAYIGWLNRTAGASPASSAPAGGDASGPYRLPSEAEWEYACRAGTTTPFSFGATISTEQANYNGNYTYRSGKKGEYRRKTTPVDSFPANAFGLYDMHGNVWEWCEDAWRENYIDAPADSSTWTGSGASSSRVLRGGSWNADPQILRSANRGGNTLTIRNNNNGFRVARAV
jgi:formylglycine-generating enzyme required for sulfatase activity